MAKTALLLDIDGTLVDSNDLHAHAWVDALVLAGYARTFDEVRPLIGMGGDKLIPLLTGLDPNAGEGQRLGERRSMIFRDRYLDKVKAFPRVRDLLLTLKHQGVVLVIATSAKDEELHGLLSRGEILDVLAKRATSDDAEQSKPDRDIIEAAMQKTGVSAAQTLMLGDTPYDRDAAKKAGVAFIGVRCGGYSEDALKGAIATYKDPAALLNHLDTSPISALLAR
jgi:HAD superfamily hydrolase (TIGR01509 family)